MGSGDEISLELLKSAKQFGSAIRIIITKTKSTFILQIARLQFSPSKI